MDSTTKKGNRFRDLLVVMLEAAGFAAETEVRIGHKKADTRWRREEIDGPVRYLVEAKDYDSTLGLEECRDFLSDYGTLVSSGQADKAWLVSKGPISPDGRLLVDSNGHLKAMTFEEFQRRLLGMDKYLQELISSYENSALSGWYIPPHTEEGADIETLVRTWIHEPDALPLAIVAGYGKGKSTFAKSFAAALAREALADQTKRIPILVSLGDIVDEQSLEGLLGKVFASGPVARGYNFGLFEKLNQAGRFLVIFDGFDEMKHGMTLARFEAMIVELMRLDRGEAKLIILGRDTAFQDDYEFKSIIMGRQITAGGQEVAASGRRPFRQLKVRDFSLEEARQFVERYFPIAAKEVHRGGNLPDDVWLASRISELTSGSLDELLVRPVHAQMLCQIATAHDVSLANLSKFRLFDLFVHFLLDREVRKRGRDDRFSLDVRRQFNSALALWLWEQGGVSTVSLSSVPMDLCKRAAAGVNHDYDESSLRKELIAGCLVEKGTSGTIYFGHRSLHEFLVAEELVVTDLRGNRGANQNNAIWYLSLTNPEIDSFIIDKARYSEESLLVVRRWFDILIDARLLMPRAVLRLFVELVLQFTEEIIPRSDEPWFAWLRYFVANRGVEFSPRSVRAIEELIALVQGNVLLGEEQQAAILLLMAEVLARTSRDRNLRAAPLIAAWLAPAWLRNVVEDVQNTRGNDKIYVQPDQDLLLWAFLHAGQVKMAPPTVRIDLVELRRRVESVFQFGLAETEDLDALDDTFVIEVATQTMYRSWELRESELDRVRPFFTDARVRNRLRPFEVVRKGRPRKVEPMQTSIAANSRSVLKLPKPLST